MQILVTEGSIFGKPRHPDSSDPQTHTPSNQSSHRSGKYDHNKRQHSQSKRQDVDETKKFPLGRLARESSDTFNMIMRLTPSQNQWLAKESPHIRKSMSKTTPINFVASKNSMKHLPLETRRDTMLNDLEALMNKYKIVSIEISDFPIDLRYERGNSGNSRLAEVLKKCPDLQYLKISNTRMYDWELIGQALNECHQLKSVDFSYHFVDRDSNNFETLFEGISHSPILTEIDFSFCHLGELGNMLASILPKFTGLTKLNLSGNDYQMAYNVVPALSKCPSLQHLELSNNKFGQFSIPHLASGLLTCTSLTYLDLSTNLFDVRDSMELGYIISSCKTLRVLSLRQCVHFTARALCALQSRSGFAHLIHLNVSDCNFDFTVDIKSFEIEEIIRKLSQCSKLAHLNLSYNPLGDVFTKKLIQILPTCTALTHLDVSHTVIKKDTIRILKQAWNTKDTHRPAEGLCIDQ
jgi:Ran GTPase-activating protein (RanGAP) involved in mRNA processing and transport